MRNSGTENKTGVYARGDASLERLLDEVCREVWLAHRETLKDTRSQAYLTELAILDALASGPADSAEIVRKVSSGERETSEEDVEAVLFGMRQEGLIRFSGGLVELVE